jgi:hypothetical protein
MFPPTNRCTLWAFLHGQATWVRGCELLPSKGCAIPGHCGAKLSLKAPRTHTRTHLRYLRTWQGHHFVVSCEA